MSNANNPLGFQTLDDCTTGGLVDEGSMSVEAAQAGCCVESVNGKKGVVVLTTDDVQEGSNLFLTNERVRAAISGEDPIIVNSTTGVISHATKVALTPAVYGSDTTYPVLTIDNKGHVTAAESRTLPAFEGVTPDLAVIEALTGSGYLVRTGINTWALRTIQGTGGRIAVTLGDPTSGNSVLDLVPVGVAGSYGTSTQVPRITIDAYGRVTGVELVTVTIPVPATPVLSIGDLSNVAAGADTPAFSGMSLVFDGSQWIAQFTPTTVSEDICTAMGGFAIVVDEVSDNNLNSVSKIGDPSTTSIVCIDAVFKIRASLMPGGSFPTPNNSIDGILIGRLPADFYPEKSTIMACPSIMGREFLYNPAADIYLGKQRVDNCSVSLNPTTGDIKLWLFADSTDYELMTESAIPYVFISVSGSYISKAALLP
jgi:hypothetical protein